MTLVHAIYSGYFDLPITVGGYFRLYLIFQYLLPSVLINV